MTKEQKDEIRRLKGEVNQPKSRLMDLMRQIERIDPKEAARLGVIIGRLESWQNK